MLAGLIVLAGWRVLLPPSLPRTGVASSRWQIELATAAELMYLGLTTLQGAHTVGEEYCDLELVGTTGRPLHPSQRVLFLALQCLVPYIVARLRRIIRRAPVPEEAPGTAPTRRYARGALRRWVSFVRSFVRSFVHFDLFFCVRMCLDACECMRQCGEDGCYTPTIMALRLFSIPRLSSCT